MNLTKIVLRGGLDISLPLVGASVMDPYVLKDADGLGPPDIDVFLSNSANQGGTLLGSRPQQRQIVLRIGLNPDYSVGETASDLRTQLYLSMSLDNAIMAVDLYDGFDVIMSTTCYVSSAPAKPFSKDPEIQLVLDSPSAFFEGRDTDATAENLFSTLIQVTNIGNAPSGFRFSITFTDAIPEFSLYRSDGLSMGFVFPFQVGDNLVVDTREGKKSANVIRGIDPPINMLAYLKYNFHWLQLNGGISSFITSSSAFTFNEVMYNPRYWGI